MSRIPTRVARAIDRLSRRAHRFHRFAHHPLCQEYAGELVRIGRRGRVCRGCTYAALGAVLGFLAGAAAPVTAARAFAPFAFAGALAAVFMSWAAAARFVHAHAANVPRTSKLWTRMLPTAGIALAACAAPRIGGVLGASCAASAVAAASALYAGYRRRGPNRHPCAACRERSGPTVCRGYASIVRRERALQRVAGRWIAAAAVRRDAA